MDKIRAIKKIKRQWMVRGCKNKETYSVSCSTELGNSIHICEECARGIIEAIEKKYGPISPPEPIEEMKTEASKEEGNDTPESENKPKRTRKKMNESGE